MNTSNLQSAIGVGLASITTLSFLYDAKLCLISKSGQTKKPDVGIPGLSLDSLDLVDGYPTSAAPAFWRKAFLRKLAILILVSVSAIYQGLDYFIGPYDEYDPLPFQKLVTFIASIGLLFISLISVSKRERVHRTTVTQLSYLLLAKTCYIALRVAIFPILEKKPLPPLLFWLLDGDIFATVLATLLVIYIPIGPSLHYPPELIYAKETLSSIGPFPEHNVSSENSASFWGNLVFDYVSDVFALGKSNIQVNLNQLFILPTKLRAVPNFLDIKAAKPDLSKWLWKPKVGSGMILMVQLLMANMKYFIILQLIAAVVAALFYAPLYFMKSFLAYLEKDVERKDYAMGLFLAIGIWLSQSTLTLVNARLWTIAFSALKPRLNVQLSTMLYDKTLRKKEVVHSNPDSGDKDGEEVQFSSKSGVMNLMTTDVSRIQNLSFLSFSIIDTFIGTSIGITMLYSLLGVSCFVGLGILFVMVPLNHLCGQYVVKNQAKIMKIRDERISLMNELLGAIRMIKFMAWERTFEKRVLKVRNRELDTLRFKFILEVIWDALGWTIPLIFTLSSYWHFALVRRQELTPSIAFTTIIIMGEMAYNLNTLPESMVQLLQALISLRRVENYLHLAETENTVESNDVTAETKISLRSATLTWPRLVPSGEASSSAPTPSARFSLVDISTAFPSGHISLICGRIGSGKTLLLLSLLGEAELLSGQVISPRSQHDLHTVTMDEDPGHWLIKNMCAYVPQSPWLRNQTIKDNIVFNMPFNAERYQQTLEACALSQDLDMLEKGDLSEIGEQGINLSGGQKARVSLARAVYSKASTLFLDDVLSAVDAHTAKHLWEKCFLGPLLKDRTVILVSHHVQLCGPDAAHIVALDNGRLQYSGSWQDFQGTSALHAIVLSYNAPTTGGDTRKQKKSEDKLVDDGKGPSSDKAKKTIEDVDNTLTVREDTQNSDSQVETVRKVVKSQASEEETRLEGRISIEVWKMYFRSCGGFFFWALTISALIMGALSPVAENVWLRIWSTTDDATKRAAFFVGVYAVIAITQTFVKISGWIFIYHGSITASRVLYADLLRMVLFAKLRFHDTLSRGRLLNRFGKDFASVDNELPEQLGKSVVTFLGLCTSVLSITYVGGWVFFVVTIAMLAFCIYIAQSFSKIARDMQRLASTTSSPLFSLYGETISGLAVIRAFGMPSRFLKDMLACIDTQANTSYWSFGLHRWLSVRFQLGSSALIGLVALLMFLNPEIDAAWAGLAIAFANTLTLDMYWFMRRSVETDQCMVAVERIREYMDIPLEPAHLIEPRPPAAWPASGAISYDRVSVRYSPELPDVLHEISFEIRAGEKIGVIGRTGSGKSTLSLSLVRFMEARQGAIHIDGIDISKIGLEDLRSRVGIIPQDPILLSGTLRSTLDIFEEYDDAEIYDTLRRVNLLKERVAPDASSVSISTETAMTHGFNNLDSPVSELGENFSTGERQLLCLARALLRRSKIMVMDEATASVDYATDEIISKTVREEFSDSTIITIAHRLRTIIDYDKIMILDGGRIVEFDRPAALMHNTNSKLYALCKATGEREFETLKAMAGV